MEPTIFLLLAVITVTASAHPLEAAETTSPPVTANSAVKPQESRLEITLKLDEQSDKEVIDNDMGKYLSRSANLQREKRFPRLLPCSVQTFAKSGGVLFARKSRRKIAWEAYDFVLDSTSPRPYS